MKSLINSIMFAFCIGAVSTFGACAAAAEKIPASSIPAENLVQPADFAAALQAHAGPAPLILQVGFRKLFDEAHIVGAEYVGAAGESDGLATLRARVAKLPKDSAILIYCGCCPWSKCPNMGAAFAALRELGFSNVKAMYIRKDFGTDWIDKGYPVTKGG
jgi:thiosulfate/3-mercaptopyruvate sulfurtransferase